MKKGRPCLKAWCLRRSCLFVGLFSFFSAPKVRFLFSFVRGWGCLFSTLGACSCLYFNIFLAILSIFLDMLPRGKSIFKNKLEFTHTKDAKARSTDLGTIRITCFLPLSKKNARFCHISSNSWCREPKVRCVFV